MVAASLMDVVICVFIVFLLILFAYLVLAIAEIVSAQLRSSSSLCCYK